MTNSSRINRSSNMVNPRNIYNSTVFVLLFLLLSVYVLLPAQLFEAVLAQERLSVSAIFILGDSTVRCGENSFYSNVFGEDSRSFPCNGSQPILIPELLAEKMGLPQIAQFYSQNGTIDGIVSGLNFGSSPSTIMSQLGLHPLNLQLRQTLDTIQLLELQMGRKEVQGFMRSSIVYISIGKDDYINLFSSESSEAMVRLGPERFAQILVDQIQRVIKDLYNADVRKIIHMGIGPLGCSPRVLYESHGYRVGSAGYGRCVNEINEFIRMYNHMLSEKLSELRLELPDSEIIFCDVYRGMMKIINHPGRYGFKDVTQACCGDGSYGGRIGCVSEELVCEDPSTHVWWDLYDPTEAVNMLLVDSIMSNQPLGQLCTPITVQQLAYI